MCEVRECPECNELCIMNFTSTTVVIECGCGVITADVMIEQDQHYVVYERFLSQYRVIDGKSIIKDLKERQ